MANRSSSPNSNLSRTPKSGVKTTPKKLPRANPYPADLRSVEHNENEADPRMNRSRSPAPKNFMSPTISAASKRKVLSEMNRSLSYFDSSDSMDSEVLNPVYHRWESPKIISNPEEERESSPPAVSADEEEVVERESESVLPPYDPKINYLSPRPRFLHYRPKPRLELFVNGDGDLKLEEESVASPKSEDRQEQNEEIESSTDLEEEPEEPPVSRSSSKIKSMGMLAFMFVLILGLTGFLLNPSWISSSSEDLMDLQKLPGNMKNWSLELAVSLREEDLGFFYALDQEFAINAAEQREIERVAEEEEEEEEENYLEEDSLIEDEEDEVPEEVEEREKEIPIADQGSEEEGEEGTHLSSLMEIAGEEREVDERETESAVTDQRSDEERERGLIKEEAAIVSGKVEERETETAVPSEEDNGVHLSLPSPHTLLGVFSALLAVVAIAIALRVKQKHEKSSSGHEELQGNYSPEMSSSGRRERVREGKLPEDEMMKGFRRDSITSSSPSYGSFTTLSGPSIFNTPDHLSREIGKDRAVDEREYHKRLGGRTNNPSARVCESVPTENHLFISLFSLSSSVGFGSMSPSQI